MAAVSPGCDSSPKATISGPRRPRPEFSPSGALIWPILVARGVNLFGMWRVQRLDQINGFNPANLFDHKSLALKLRKKQIGGV